jgi:hypothetical protein
LALAGNFNGLGIFFHVLCAQWPRRIGSPDYAMDRLQM